jgi:hypothetical protein
MGRDLAVNPETGAITGAAVPDEYVKPAYRAGWGW